MRRRYQNRSIFGLVFWSLLLGGGTLYTAWKFDWLSVDLADMIGRYTNSPESDEPTLAETPLLEPAGGATVEGAVFTDQSEPPVEFTANEPPQMSRAEEETTARLRELQQRHSSRDTGAGSADRDTNYSTRMPNNPFAEQRPANAVGRQPSANDSYLQDEPTESRMTDFRPQPQNRSPGSASAGGNDPTTTPPSSADVSNDRTGLASRYAARNAHERLTRDFEDAERVVQASNEEPQLAAAPVSAAVPEALGEVDRLIAANDILGAHRELSKAYWSHPELRGVLRQRIEQTAETIYFSPQPHFLEPYVVQDGDQFAKFAKQYDVPWQYLARLNRVDPTRIRAGQKLKVIRGPFSAVVELSRFELTIHAHGYYVRRYDVGIGKQGSSPVGKHVVLDKVANPQYTDPEGRVVDADDPSNPLGERWIDLGDSYGIHGTIDPNSIGKAESRGCIRLRNDDVAEVYDLLSVGSEVVIRP